MNIQPQLKMQDFPAIALNSFVTVDGEAPEQLVWKACGDAFTAAMIYATLEDMPIESVMDYAMAAGIAAIGHERTINPQMSISLLESILKEYKQ